MPDIDHVHIRGLLGPRASAKLQLQKLAQKIDEDWGNPNPLRPDIDRSWQVIQAYIHDCLWLHWPVPPVAPDWKTIATAEAHFTRYIHEMESNDFWKDIRFPLKDFFNAWILARREFVSELREWAPEPQISIDWAPFTVHSELLFEEDAPLTGEPSLCHVNVLAFDDPSRPYSICCTGWSYMSLPTELKHLDLNEVATGDLVAISDLRSKVRTNISVFKKAQERALAMFRLPASGPPDPQSTSSVQSTSSQSTSSDIDASD